MKLAHMHWILALAHLALTQSAFAGWAVKTLPMPTLENQVWAQPVGVSGGDVLMCVYVGRPNCYGAVLWQNDTASYANMTGGQGWVEPYGMSGSTAVGHVGRHAAKWVGSADNMVDLNPAGAYDSYARAISGSMIVGDAKVQNIVDEYWTVSSHAGYWNSDADSWHDLNPGISFTSWAYATDGVQQVGIVQEFDYRTQFIPGGPQACVWNGTPESFVNLNPTGATWSEATGVSDGTQVGSAIMPANNYEQHAGLWRGTAGSWVDLHPAGATTSEARGILGSTQIGYWENETTYHAMLWHGTAESALDLHQFLPSQYNVSGTGAIGTGPNGEIWIVGMAGNTETRLQDIVIWYMVPEPCSFMVLTIGLGTLGLYVRRRKCVAIDHEPSAIPCGGVG